jgi:hypothetical protein
MDPDPDPTPDLTPFFIDFKDVKQIFFFIFFFHIFFHIAHRHIIFILKFFNFFLKFCVQILFCTHYFSPLYTFMRKGKDPDPNPYL